MKIKKISEVIGSRVYTDAGDYFGDIEQVNLSENRINGWKIRLGPSAVSSFQGVRGVVIPHQFVRAISDIFLVNKAALPAPVEPIGKETDEFLD